MKYSETPIVLVSDSGWGVNRDPCLSSLQTKPRRDYVEIARQLGAQVIACDTLPFYGNRILRGIENRIKLRLIGAMLTANRLTAHSTILSTSEKVAIPLAAMLQARRKAQATTHVVIGHKLSSGLKRPLFRAWKLHNSFTQLVCVSQAQAEYARTTLGMPAERVTFVRDKVDHHFFRPLRVQEEDYVLAIGREQRDYETLLQALQGTGIRLIVVASSHWREGKANITRGIYPGMTVLSQVSYLTLRRLYARARLIVVPLHDVEYAAGVNSLLEAMAMGKPVIVTRTRGLSGYVCHESTGWQVPANDVRAMRDAICALHASEKERLRLGSNARQAIENGLNLDAYVERILHLMGAIAGRSAVAARGLA